MASKLLKVLAVLLLQVGLFGFAPSMAQVADPTISVAGGPSTSPQTALVTVSDTTTPVTIYYTTDGTAPTPSSATVTSGSTLLISQNATLKVQAYSGTTSSNVVASQYTNAGMVSAGARHTLILKSNGTVFATGDDTYGELGIGDTTGATKLNPVQVMESSTVPLTGIVNIAAGADESFAVDSSGNVWSWGYNMHGELALGTTTNTLYATQITTLTNIIGVASNQYHTLALQANGSVWSFGADGSGQVGNGATASYVTQATKVVAPNGQPGYLSGIVAVAAGANHSLALDNAGMLWSWGSDGYSQLGDDDSTLTSQTSPVSVINGSTGAALANVIGVAANATNSFALRNDGSVFACGDNSTGELGAGNTTASLTATQVSFLSGSTMTAVGNEAAVDPNGNMWTWGSNNNGQLSIGYTGYYATLPLEVNPLATSSPTLTVTTGNGQTVTDGSLSGPFTITAKNGTTNDSGAWVNLVIASTSGLLGTTSSSTQLSPIIGGVTGTNGQVNFYLDGSGTGNVSLTSTSGSSSTTLSVIEQMAQIASSGEPTMPQWMLIIMAAALVYFATRQKIRPTG